MLKALGAPPARSWILVAALLFPLASGAVEAAPTLVLGAEDEAAPWSYADGQGYVNDLVRLAFKSQGWLLRLDIMPYARCKQMALSGMLAGCFTTSREPELADKLLFPSRPVISPHHILVVRSNSSLAGCQSERWGRAPTVAIVNGYEYAEGLEALLKSSRLLANKVKSESVALRMLALNRTDVAAVTLDDVKQLEFLLEDSALKPAQFKVLCDYGSIPGFVAFSAAHPMGREALIVFEHGFAAITKSGEIARLQQRWRDLAPTLPRSAASGGTK